MKTSLFTIWIILALTITSTATPGVIKVDMATSLQCEVMRAAHVCTWRVENKLGVAYGAKGELWARSGDVAGWQTDTGSIAYEPMYRRLKWSMGTLPRDSTATATFVAQPGPCWMRGLVWDENPESEEVRPGDNWFVVSDGCRFLPVLGGEL